MARTIMGHNHRPSHNIHWRRPRHRFECEEDSVAVLVGGWRPDVQYGIECEPGRTVSLLPMASGRPVPCIDLENPRLTLRPIFVDVSSPSASRPSYTSGVGSRAERGYASDGYAMGLGIYADVKQRGRTDRHSGFNVDMLTRNDANAIAAPLLPRDGPRTTDERLTPSTHTAFRLVRGRAYDITRFDGGSVYGVMGAHTGVQWSMGTVDVGTLRLRAEPRSVLEAREQIGPRVTKNRLARHPRRNHHHDSNTTNSQFMRAGNPTLDLNGTTERGG